MGRIGERGGVEHHDQRHQPEGRQGLRLHVPAARIVVRGCADIHAVLRAGDYDDYDVHDVHDERSGRRSSHRAPRAIVDAGSENATLRRRLEGGAAGDLRRRADTLRIRPGGHRRLFPGDIGELLLHQHPTNVRRERHDGDRRSGHRPVSGIPLAGRDPRLVVLRRVGRDIRHRRGHVRIGLLPAAVFLSVRRGGRGARLVDQIGIPDGGGDTVGDIRGPMEHRHRPREPLESPPRQLDGADDDGGGVQGHRAHLWELPRGDALQNVGHTHRIFGRREGISFLFVHGGSDRFLVAQEDHNMK